MTEATKQFVPPSAVQVREHLDRHPATGPNKLWLWLPMLMLAGVLVLAMSGDGGGILLAWTILVLVVVTNSMRLTRGRRLEAQALQVQELTLLRHYPQALRQAWLLIPALKANPELHARLVAMLGHALDQMRYPEQALEAYDWLLARLPGGHPVARQLQVQRAIALLAAERLADADQAIRSLRELGDSPAPTPLSAGYRFAQLYQRVHAGHDADALELAADLVPQLQPLGVEAAYGYALLALAHHRMLPRRPEETDALAQEARCWWSRATLLLPTAVLAARLPEVRPLVDDPLLQPATQPAAPTEPLTALPRVQPIVGGGM